MDSALVSEASDVSSILAGSTSRRQGFGWHGQRPREANSREFDGGSSYEPEMGQPKGLISPSEIPPTRNHSRREHQPSSRRAGLWLARPATKRSELT